MKLPIDFSEITVEMLDVALSLLNGNGDETLELPEALTPVMVGLAINDLLSGILEGEPITLVAAAGYMVAFKAGLVIGSTAPVAFTTDGNLRLVDGD